MIPLTVRRTLAALLTVAVMAAACGDDGDEVGDPPESTTTTVGDGTTTTTTTAAAGDTTTTTTTTTTVPEPTGPESLPLEDIVDLVLAWGAGDGDPLQLAKDITGFPLDIPVPDGTTPHGIRVDLSGGDTDATWEWDWSYEVLSTEPMPDIDIRSEEPSPGYVALSDFYDPIMADLGYRRTGTTGSDPGDEGGPHSVNHVYQSDAETLIVNGLEAIPEPIFAWADEEQVFGEGIPGYQVDAPFEFEAGVVPVPLFLTLIDNFPALDDATLVDADITSWSRPEDSFDADLGLRYFDTELVWAIGDAEGAPAQVLAELDGTVFVAGSESFFDPGFLEPEEPRINGTEWRQTIVFLNHYEGAITIDSEDSTLELAIRFEPGRVELQAPEE